MNHLDGLPDNGNIFVTAPAFPPNPKQLEKGILYLEKKGYHIQKGKSLSGHYGYLSATDTRHAHELNEAFGSDSIDAIICARGGWGCLRYLDLLDYETIARNPKVLVGYSDITFLQLAIWKKCEIPSISGPMVAVEMGRGIEPFTEKFFWDLIHARKAFSIDLTQNEIRIRKPGVANGRLLGGCLSMMAHLLGTPYSPDYKNAILFIEDVGEAPYKIDRYLAQLKQAGIFKQASGIILGQFLDCKTENNAGFDIAELIAQYFDDLDCPVLENFPYGHGMKKISMPIGAATTLDTPKATLTFQSIWNSLNT